MTSRRNVAWSIFVMLASIACSAIWPLGWAPSYGPLIDCTETSTGVCVAPLGNDTVTI